MAVKRIGQVIGIKPEDIEEYEDLHANDWPSIIKIINQVDIFRQLIQKNLPR